MEMEVGVWGNRTEVVAEVDGAGGGSGQVGRGGCQGLAEPERRLPLTARADAGAMFTRTESDGGTVGGARAA